MNEIKFQTPVFPVTDYKVTNKTLFFLEVLKKKPLQRIMKSANLFH